MAKVTTKFKTYIDDKAGGDKSDYTDTFVLLDRLEDAVREYVLASLPLTANNKQLETADSLMLAFSEGE